MKNIRSIISAHIKKILNINKKSFGCNCRIKENCTLNEECLPPRIIQGNSNKRCIILGVNHTKNLYIYIYIYIYIYCYTKVIMVKHHVGILQD